MIDAPVFRSVNQALHLSYLMAVLPPTQKSPTMSVINELMDMAGIRREVEREGTVNFAGLSPLEVRGQCAMVIGAVRHQLQPAERYAIEAWYAHDASKAEAVHWLRDWCAPHWTIEAPSARTLIAWHVNLPDDTHNRHSCSERLICGEHGLPKTTVHDQIVKIRKAVMTLRRHGMDQLEWMFSDKGLIGEPA